MEEWLDDLARSLARGASRREALGWLGRRAVGAEGTGASG